MKTEIKKRGQRRSAGKIVFITAIFAVVFMFAIHIVIAIIESPIRISVVERSSLEDVLNLDGYIFREQHLIYSSVGGVLEAAISDGERVGRGERVAVVYMGSIPADVMERLRRINEQMAGNAVSGLQRELFVHDPIAFERREIATETTAIIEAVYFRDGERLSSARRALDDLIEKRNLALGIAPPERVTMAELQQQRHEIEQSYGISSVDLIAPSAGVFVSVIDGLEDYLQSGRIRDLMPGDIDEINEIPLVHNSDVVPERAAAKIVNNLEWYFVAVVDTVRIHPLTQGNAVELRFFDIADRRIAGTVAYISPDQDGRSVIAVLVRGYVDSIYSLSRVSVDLIRQTHRGLRVETSALRFNEEGQAGVFVLRHGRASFREINILHSANDWMIIEEVIDPFRAETVVRGFDQVIISSRDLTDGDVVGR